MRNLIDVELPRATAYNPNIDDVYDFGWQPGPFLTRKQDWQIVDDIKNEMYWSPFVDAKQITVVFDEGVATLSGTVDSFTEYNAAVENALEGGAWRVENKAEGAMTAAARRQENAPARGARAAVRPRSCRRTKKTAALSPAAAATRLLIGGIGQHRLRRIIFGWLTTDRTQRAATMPNTDRPWSASAPRPARCRR